MTNKLNEDRSALNNKPDYFTSPWSYYGEWMKEDWLKKTWRNKLLIALSWLWFELGGIADWLLNHLEE